MIERSANIHRSRVHEDMVQRLCMIKLADAERTLFPTIREFLCFAALLGYSEKRFVPLDTSVGTEDVSYQQFQRGDAEDIVYLLALAHSKDPEILRDGEEAQCAAIFEQYANGGLYVLREALAKRGGEFPDRDILEMLRECGYLGEEAEEPDLSRVSF